MISLRAKLAIALAVLSVLLLAALFVVAFLADGAGYSGLMLVTPNGGAAQGITPETAESLRRGEGLMLTYEISSHAMVGAVNSSHSATLVGTNSAYLDITGYRLVSGGFFTGSAWGGRNRFAALNESAAFTMFGGANIDGQVVTIDGQLWIVTGVVDDGREDSRIFVPSSVGGGSIRSLLLSTESKAGAANVLGGVGVRDGDYDFISLCAVAGTTGERFAVACKVAACLALILLAVWGFATLGKIYGSLRRETDNYYLRELLAYRRADVVKIVILAALSLGAVATTLSLSLQVLATALRWRDISLPVWYPGMDFAYMLEVLRNFHAASTWVFGAYLIVVFAAAVTIGRV